MTFLRSAVRMARLASSIVVAATAIAAAASSVPADHAAIQEAYGRLPITFERNMGQAPAPYEYVSHGSRFQLLLGRDSAVLYLAPSSAGRSEKATMKAGPVTLRFVGARDGALRGEEEAEGKTNYLWGPDAADQITNVPNFGAVRRTRLYEGIDARFYGNQRELEYDFIVAPGADPLAIRMAFDGVRSVTIDRGGDLVLDADGARLIQKRPIAYQMVGEKKKQVRARYRKIGSEIALALGPYDHGRPLVIDPALSFSTYLGGVSQDGGAAIVASSTGNAFLLGWTQSSKFPGLNGFDKTLGGFQDLFIVKLNAAGNGIVYSTYLGGRGVEDAAGLAVDGSGNAYILGHTTDNSYPVTAGAYQTYNSAATNWSVLTKLNATGSALVYSTYINGTIAHAVAVDANGNAYVAGEANSAYVTTAGAYQTVGQSGGTTGFVLKLNAAGTAAGYSTFLGGNGTDYGKAIAVDAAGSAYVAGVSKFSSYPTTPGVFQTVRRASETAFVTKLNPTGSGLVYSTYLGGSVDDVATGIAVDTQGNAHVTGQTTSGDFPTANPFQPSLRSSDLGNAFITKLNATGTALVYSSFHGGSGCPNCGTTNGGDMGSSVAVDASGYAYFTGRASSPDFPVLAPILPDKRTGPVTAAFITKVSPYGYRFYSVLIGGSGQGSIGETGDSVALDGAGGVYITGETISTDFPVLNALQATIGSTSGDAFITKISSPAYTATLATTSNNVDSAHPATLTATVTKQGSPTPPTGSVNFVSGAFTLAQVPLNNGTGTTDTASFGPGVYPFAAVYNSAGDGASSTVVYQAINQASPCTTTTLQPVPANAPFVVLIAPFACSSASVGSAVTIQADTADPDGRVTSVAFYANGTPIGSASSFPYSTSWTPSIGGVYTLTAVATDNSSTATTSAPVQVTVNAPPVVHITSPPTGSSASVGSVVVVSADDPTGTGNISSVAFFDNGSLIGTSNVAPFTVNWIPQTVGIHVLTAQATNSFGVGNSDNSPSINVIANSPPVVSIAAPLDGATLDTPANTTITATATDNDSVAQVQFFVNGASIGTATSTTTTFSVPWMNVGPGVYTLTAVATDNAGATTTSTAITVKVAMHTDAGETIVFLHNDFAGNPIAGTDTTGSILWKESYRPFGDRLVGAAASGSNRQWFAGKPADADTGLSYFGARYYDSVAGRFMGADSAPFNDANVHSFNKYAFGNNNPLRHIDPDGNSPIDLAFLAVDLVQLGSAIYSGEGVAAAVVNVGISAIGVVSPIPGTGIAIKGLRAADKAVEAARVLEINKEAGRLGEALTRGKLEQLGENINEQVTIVTSTGARTRADFVIGQDGKFSIVESKTGNASLTAGQKQLKSDIANGIAVTPVGKNAQKAGLEAGEPVRFESFREDRNVITR